MARHLFPRRTFWRAVALVPLLALLLLPTYTTVGAATPTAGASLFVQTAMLTATGEAGCNPPYSCAYGEAVALSADGNTALVGAKYDNASAGAAFVFVRIGGVWTQQGSKLTASGGGSCFIGVCYFGTAVALSGDGNTALISAPYQSTAYIFVRTGTTWSQQQIVPNSGGDSVALSADGNTAVVNNGAAVYTRSGVVWNPQQALPVVGYVALSGDGNTVVVGVPSDNRYTGVAYIYVRNGGTWTQQAGPLYGIQLYSSDCYPECDFGWSVALSADGNTAAVGEPGRHGYQGAAYVYARSGGGWTQQASRLTTSECPGFTCGIGTSVGLSGDGNTLLTGAPYELSAKGVFFEFARTGTTWTQQGMQRTINDTPGVSLLANKLAMSADGKTALLGAAGGAYIFEKHTLVSIAVSGPTPILIPQAPQYQATGTFEDGQHYPIPGGTWQSSDQSIATVGPNGYVSGNIISLRPGTATISYTLNGITGEQSVTIVGPTSIAITTNGTAGFTVGQRVPLTATGTLSDGSTPGLSGGTWQSSDPTIATIDASGVVTGQRAGTVTITYNFYGMVTQVTVTITAPTPIGLTIPSGRASGATSGSGSPSPAPAGRASGAAAAGAGGPVPNPLPSARP